MRVIPPPPPHPRHLPTPPSQNKTLKSPPRLWLIMAILNSLFAQEFEKVIWHYGALYHVFRKLFAKWNNQMTASVLPEVTQNDLSGLLVNLTSKTTICSASLCALNNEKSSLKFPLVLITKHLFSLVTYTILLSVTFGPPVNHKVV